MSATQPAKHVLDNSLSEAQAQPKGAKTPLRDISKMAVYTELSRQDLDVFLSQYSVGELQSYEGVTAGVENTNYRLVLEYRGQPRTAFLTIFEKHDSDEIPYFVDLLEYLSDRRLPVASPIKDNHGESFKRLKNKPAVLMACIEGEHPEETTEAQCHAIGAFLANMHTTGKNFPLNKDNPRGHSWWDTKGHELAKSLNAFDANLMLDELGYLKEHWPKAMVLPYGIVHADLFIDNAFFKGDQLSGVIDFYNACDDIWLFDLAICATDWCKYDNYLLNKSKLKALIEGYQSVRALTPLEIRMWPTMLRAAAMRFWCSRLEDWLAYQENPVEGLTPKNPDDMKHILLDRQRHHYDLEP